MHGKATLILKDKDTGRVVERREEHNMLTNALKNIFTLPPELAYDTEYGYIFNGYLPMYENLLKGLVLFSDTIPENANNFMLSGNYHILATAGDVYSGTDIMRGSFNENSSCEIENGYRFVWDFAPEKAVGTIKCLALSHKYTGNRGNLSLSGSSCNYLINAGDLSNTNNSSRSVAKASNSIRYFLKKGKYIYAAVGGSDNVTIRKYRLCDPLAIKICDNYTAVLDDEIQISLGFSTQSSNSTISYDPVSEKLYAAYISSYANNGRDYHSIKYAAINPETGEIIAKTDDYVLTEVPYYNNNKSCFYNNKFYFCGRNEIIYVCSLSGTIEKTLNLGLYSINSILTVNGKIAVDCKLTSGGRQCIYYLDEPNTQLGQTSDYPRHIPIEASGIAAPYCYAYYPYGSSTTLKVMFRTDYLATINNLSAPLVKTDQHALQIRYEITN